MPSASGWRTETRTTGLPARSIRSAAAAHHGSSTRRSRAARLHLRHQALLDGGVMRERAVAVEMILGDVEQDADPGIEARRQIDLVGGALDHMDAPGLRRLERQDRGADVAAELGVVAGALEQMRHQGGGGRFPVGARDDDEDRVGRAVAPLAAEQLDVADHLDIAA